MATCLETIKLAGPDRQGLLKVVQTKNTKILYPGELVTKECFENHLLPMSKRSLSGVRRIEFTLVEPQYKPIMRDGQVQEGYFPTVGATVIRGYADLKDR